MRTHRDHVIVAAVRDAGLPPAFAGLLQDECPWLDGQEHVVEDLGPDLVADQARVARITRDQARAFFRAYNQRVRALSDPIEAERCAAFEQMHAVLAAHGRADAFGHGDHWLNAESFSTRAPVLTLFNGFSLPDALLPGLQQVLAQHAGLFDELRVVGTDGREVLRLRA